MKTLLILGTILLSVSAFAGNEKGNGGGIHYCEGQKTQEFYDIYEAQARFGYKLIDKKLSVEGYIQYAVNRISKANPFIGKKVQEQLDYLKNNHMIIRPKARLNPIGDAKILITDEGCDYKQLANWDEVSGNLLVKKEYYDLLDNLNQAAFHIHETLYKVGRDYDLLTKFSDGTSTSDEIRMMVGEIFSVNESLSLMWTIVDPQIEIDRKINENEAQGKISHELVQECLDLNKKTNELREVARDNLTTDSVQKYSSAHLFAVETCTQNKVFAEGLSNNPFVTSSFRFAMAMDADNLRRIIENAKKADNEFFYKYIKPAKN